MRSRRGATFVEYLLGVAFVVLLLVAAAAVFGRAFLVAATCAGTRIGLLDRASHAATCGGPAAKLSGSAAVPVPGQTQREARELVCDNLHCYPAEQEACFVAGTPVATPLGPRPIEQLAAGDEVFGADALTGDRPIARYRVVATKLTADRPTLELRLGVGQAESALEVTPEHPFLELSRDDGPGWSRADALRRGARVATAFGDATVLSVSPRPEKTAVYNVEVEGVHTYFVGAFAALVHNSYDPDEEWIRAELKLPKPGAKQESVAPAIRKLADGGLAKDKPLPLAKPPKTLTAPERTRLAALETAASEAHQALVQARAAGRDVDAAALRYRDAVAAQYAAVDTLRAGATLLPPVPERKKLTEAERDALLQRLLAALEERRKPGESTDEAVVAMRVILPPEEFAAFEKAVRDLAPNATAIKNFEDALVRAEALIPNDPQVRAILGDALTRYRTTALRRLEGKGGDPVALEQAAARARYLDAKRILAAPDQSSPFMVGRAKDIVAAYEGRPPSFEQYKAEKAALDAELKEIQDRLAKYGPGTGGPGEASPAAARLLVEQRRLLQKQRDLDRDHERDVVDAAKQKSADDTALRAAKVADLERKQREAKDPVAAQALAKEIAAEKAALAAAEAKAVADAKDALAKSTTAPLREKADKMWIEFREWRKNADADGRARDLRQVEAELERWNKRVADLKFEVDHYEHPWKQDGKIVTKRTDGNGKVIAKEVVEAELLRVTADRDRLALKAAQMKRDLALVERDEAIAWRAFRDAEKAAQDAELRLALVGRGPVPLGDELPARFDRDIREYMKSIGKPLPEETQEGSRIAWQKKQLALAERLAREAKDAIPGREQRLTDAEAALAAAKARLDASKVKEALAGLADPPPPPRDDIHARSPGAPPPAKPSLPEDDRAAKAPTPPKQGPPGPTLDWDASWRGLGQGLDATNPIPPAMRPKVARLAKDLVHLTERIDKWHDKMSAAELRQLDAETAALKRLRDELRAAGVDVDRPGVKLLFDLVDVVAEARKQLGHFTVGVREEFVKLVTGLVGLGGKLVRFQNDPAYREDVKQTIDKLSELAGQADGNKVLRLALKEVKAEFEKDPARALGRVTGFIATFFIPFEKPFEAFAQLGKSGARLGELAADGSKAGKLASESATVAKDLSVAARALEDAGAAARTVNREIDALLAEAKALRVAGKEAEALSKLAAANARIEALQTIVGAMREWEASAKAAVSALKAAKADAAVIAAAEADLARAQAGLKELVAAEKLAADAGKIAEAEGALAKAQAAVSGAAKAGDLKGASAAGKALDLLPPKCFVAGTRILVASYGPTSVASHKAIEDIAIGDQVLAESEESGELAVRTVTHLFRSVSDHVRQLELTDAAGRTSVLGTTDGHPFFVEGRGWTLAGELRDGDYLRQYDGARSLVVGSARIPKPEGILVYNFEVEGLHDYFVSAHDDDAPVLVHNRCLAEIFADLARTDPTRAKQALEGWQRLQALGKDADFARLVEAVERGTAPESRAIDVFIVASQRDPKEVLAAVTKRLDEFAAKKPPAEIGTYPGTTKITETSEALQKAGVPAGVPIKSEYGVAREMVTGLPTLDAKGGFTWHAEKMDAALRGLQSDAIALRKMLPELQRLSPAEAARAQKMLDATEARILEIKPFMDQYRRRHLDYPNLWEVKNGKIVPKLDMPFDPKVNGPARLPNMLPGEAP